MQINRSHESFIIKYYIDYTLRTEYATEWEIFYLYFCRGEHSSEGVSMETRGRYPYHNVYLQGSPKYVS